MSRTVYKAHGSKSISKLLRKIAREKMSTEVVGEKLKFKDDCLLSTNVSCDGASEGRRNSR